MDGELGALARFVVAGALAALIGALGPGCGETEPSADAGAPARDGAATPDGAAAHDAGQPIDAGAEADGGPAPAVNECELGTDECIEGIACIDLPVGYECGPCPDGQIGDGRICAPRGTVQISAATDSACLRDAEGVIRCWGSNFFGQLGDGTTLGRPTPVVLEAERYRRVDLGGFGRHVTTCGLTTDGRLRCWGSNTGRWQPAAGAFVPEPEPVGDLDGWQSVTSGGELGCGVRAGELYCWGVGYLGDDTPSGSSTPVRIGTDGGWASVRAGHRRACALREDGTLHCWGELSTGVVEASPTQVGTHADWEQVFLAASGYATCGIRAGGQLYCWNHPLTAMSTSPARVGERDDWVEFRPGSTFACGLRRDGSVWCTQTPLTAVLGPSDMTLRRVDLPEAANDVAVGASHACAASASGRTFCWGTNALGQLGTGQRGSRAAPEATDDATYETLATSAMGTCGARTDGSLHCWGGNLYEPPASPSWPSTGPILQFEQRPRELDAGTGWSSLAVGSSHFCGARDGELLCWGVVGLDDLPTAGTPTRVGADVGWTQVRTSNQHTCGIRDGGLYCFGLGRDGQTGDPDPPVAGGPMIRVGSESDWERVAVAMGRTCGIRGGALYCFGRDPLSGSTTHVPERVGVETGWTDVALSFEHACGIRNGDLYCWGANRSGLGTGTHDDQPSPVPVGEPGGWAEVGATAGTSCGIRAGALYCWGALPVTHLFEDPTLGPAPTPTRLGARDDWANLVVGPRHVCATAGGVVHCWGDGSLGVLGHGDAFSLQPVPVTGG